MTPFERQVLPNGLIFLYRRSPGVPLAAATLILRVGSWHESSREAGLASFAAELMLQGTRRRNARRLADDIESVGASLGCQTSEDYTEVGFTAPISQLPRLLDILSEVLVQPAFPTDEIKKEKDSVLAALKSRKDAIFNLAYDALNRELFGAHPYGRPIDGNEQVVRRLTRADLQAWHRRFVRPDRAILSMVASLPAGEARRQVEHHLAAWRSPVNALAVPPEPRLSPARRKQVSLKAPFEQAYYMIGMRAPTVTEPDYVPLKVLNTILGGGMSSRLFVRLREELSLAYEVSSFFPTHLHPSQWVMYLGVPPERLALAKRELGRLLDICLRKAPTAGEIRQAVAMIEGSYLMEHQTRRRQAWYAGWWEFLGKDQAFDARFLDAVRRVTPAQIQEVARRVLRQPQVTVEVTPKK
jgi:zinc protease